MADIDKRLRYYNGQFLQEQDFTAEQQYNLDRTRRHNRQLHTYGIAEGLTVTAAVGASSAVVSPGTALDGEGRTIVLTESRNVSFGSLTNQWVLVVISYKEQTSDPAAVGDEGDTRWWERPDVEVIAETGAPAADVRVRLARLQIAANGTVAQHDTAVRTSAGVRLGTEVAIERIRLSRQGVASNLWPVLSSGAANQADVTGNLSVTGNILVTGTVDGRDVSVDGATLDTHKARTDNPHGTTATQVGAITGVGGVLNPGGQVNLLAGSNIAITADNGTNKRITIAGATIGGVANPGGNINFVGQGGISITPDNSAKQIAFNTSPAAIGALATTDYLRRIVTYGSFADNETTKQVTCGFLPKQISIGLSLWSAFGGYYNTLYPSAYAAVTSTSSWTSVGSFNYIARYTSAPYWESYSYPGTANLAVADFYDISISPYRHSRVIITLDSVSDTGFVLKVERSTFTTSTFPIYVYFSLAILG